MADRSAQLESIMTTMCELATDLVRAASAAERAAWDMDVRGLSEASEKIAELHGRFHDRYVALLVADHHPAPRGADACSL
jgi:hypothetical protein